MHRDISLCSDRLSIFSITYSNINDTERVNNVKKPVTKEIQIRAKHVARVCHHSLCQSRDRTAHVMYFNVANTDAKGPPLWSSGQSFWLQIQRSRVRFPVPPDFLSSSGSGTGSTQPREVN